MKSGNSGKIMRFEYAPNYESRIAKLATTRRYALVGLMKEGRHSFMNKLAKLFRVKDQTRGELAAKWEFGMTTRQEQQWLRNYAERRYCGSGAIVDLSCFLRGTTIMLTEGLALNRKGKNQQIHAYDLFTWDDSFESWAKGREVEGIFKIGDSFFAGFLRRTEKWRDYIVAHVQDLKQARWEQGPIEFLYIDAMKSSDLASTIAVIFLPHLIPGKGYLAHQDFPHAFAPWIHFLTFRLRNHIRFVEDLPQSSLFRLEKEIDPSILMSDIAPVAVSPEEIEAAFDYSISIVGDNKKANVVAAKSDDVFEPSRTGARARSDCDELLRPGLNG